MKQTRFGEINIKFTEACFKSDPNAGKLEMGFR